MKKIIVLCTILISSAHATNNEHTDWIQSIEPQFDISSEEERIVKMIQQKSNWMWNPETKQLAFCVHFQKRDALCTNIPNEFNVQLLK